MALYLTGPQGLLQAKAGAVRLEQCIAEVAHALWSVGRRNLERPVDRLQEIGAEAASPDLGGRLHGVVM